MTEERRLSQVDMFFVAYQERTGILMLLGCEVSLRGRLSRELLEAGLAHIVGRWPRLGQRLRKRIFGLEWSGPPDAAAILREGSDPGELDGWRNRPIDPFREPPFQLLWIAEGERHILSFRVHHSVADGESLFLVCRDLVHFLATRNSTSTGPEPHPPLGFTSFFRRFRARALVRVWAYGRWLASEARRPQSARLPLRSLEPGDVAVLADSVGAAELDEIRRLASALRVATTALFAAAWVRALHQWSPSPSISLEVPVSLRRRLEQTRWLGNYVAPLVVVGDARESLGDLALTIHRQLAQGYRGRLHLATVLFTSFARFLPWGVFRRLSVGTSSTGFATGHFTALRAPADLDAELRAISSRDMELMGVKLWTPVCRTMGAALAILELPAAAEVFLTYRRNALSPREARSLADLLLAELRSAARLERRRLA